MNRKAVAVVAGLFGCSILTTSQPAAAASPSRPNIVFVLVDNLGYGDIGANGGGALRGAPTPNIDRLAASGTRLTNFNVEPECTPSRSALLTGRMPIRSGTSSVDVTGGRDGMSSWEYTLAELLSDSGYSTALFGKWHLGSEPGRLPTMQGFDIWYGIQRTSDEAVWQLQPGYDPALVPEAQIMEAKKGSPARNVKPYDFAARRMIDTEITQRSVDYIKAQANTGRPFFLFVSYTLPHSPAATAPEYTTHSKTQYQNALAEIDAHTGEIVKALSDAGIDDNTIVVWASDNGPETMKSNGADFAAEGDSGPFRGEFPSALEGAIRTPAIVRWPGHAKSGRVTNEIISILDFYRTFADVAHASAKVPTDRAIDSVNQANFLFGDAPRSPRESVIFFHSGKPLAIKWHNFKVHYRMNQSATGPVVSPGQGMVTGVQTELVYPWIFDVENDPKELWNINISSSWVFPLVSKVFREYLASVKRYPNLAPGQDGPPEKP